MKEFVAVMMIAAILVTLSFWFMALICRRESREIRLLRLNNACLKVEIAAVKIDASCAWSKSETDTRVLLSKCRRWIEATRDGVLYPIAQDFDGVVGRNAEGLGQEVPDLLDAIDAMIANSKDPITQEVHP